jgi:hypothetical protein
MDSLKLLALLLATLALIGTVWGVGAPFHAVVELVRTRTTKGHKLIDPIEWQIKHR